MHRYLRAIGFNNIKSKREEKTLLRDVARAFSKNQVISQEQEDYVEYKKTYGAGIGISSCGMLDEGEKYEMDYYFPYLQSHTVSSYADIVVNKRKENDMYLGICEDIRIGVSLIFHLQNGMEYKQVLQEGRLDKKGTSVSLVGLALTGTILLPIMKTPTMIQNSKDETRNRLSLVSAAKKGDSSAMESLTIDDMDTYTTISRRILVEDVFSIVDTYLMPYGIECDEYSVMGEIKELKKIENIQTKIWLYQMVLEINEMHMEVCIPVDSVIGEPEVGRRLKAVVWIQGQINFPK